MTNPPFMPEKGKPALHLREWTPEEVETYWRLRLDMETRARLVRTKEKSTDEQVSGHGEGTAEGSEN